MRGRPEAAMMTSTDVHLCCACCTPHRAYQLQIKTKKRKKESVRAPAKESARTSSESEREGQTPAQSTHPPCPLHALPPFVPVSLPPCLPPPLSHSLLPSRHSFLRCSREIAGQLGMVVSVFESTRDADCRGVCLRLRL